MTRPYFPPKGLSVKFALTITAVVAGVAFTIGAVIVTLDWQRYQTELESKALLLAHSVAVTAPDDILQNDSWSLYKSLKNMANDASDGMQDTKILTGMIQDPDGNVLAHLNPGNNPLGMPLIHSGEVETRFFTASKEVRVPTILNTDISVKGFLEAVAPIYSDGKLLGVVRVRLSYKELYQKAQRSSFVIIGMTLALVALGSFLGTMISRRITKPLTAMTEGIEAVSSGELSDIKPIPVNFDDELGVLANAFNKMAKEMVEKKSLEEQIAVSEKLVALGRISAGVAHEVNNPLAGLMNCIDTLKKHPDDPELVERYLPLLDKGLNRIKNIVESLLIELRTEEAHGTDNSSSLEDLRDIVVSEINDRDIILNWDNTLGEQVLINRRRVQQIVLNLLKNSIQALPDKGVVSFSTRQNSDTIILVVTDDGPGIPAQYKSQLFDPFFTTKINGTGLGLWIVYRLAESMQGVIEVESEVGMGTQFKVTLPLIELST
ncbi:MAG: HAMP domain-containing protein [Rhodospirillales bacterium]|jgi:two-component system, NtrC family, sensor kinase|nr:HAMP domain-containing protein [Rhodospirillales bacterium]